MVKQFGRQMMPFLRGQRPAYLCLCGLMMKKTFNQGASSARQKTPPKPKRPRRTHGIELPTPRKHAQTPTENWLLSVATAFCAQALIKQVSTVQ